MYRRNSVPGTNLAPVRPDDGLTVHDLRARRRTWPRIALLGPAFVAAVAYVDPGNFVANVTAGAKEGYRLAWVVVMANLMAIMIQYIASKVGLATSRSLPELCAVRFNRATNLMLWVQAEIVAMATDLAEFVGAAIGLNLVFGVPLLPAGLITAAVAFLILGLEQRKRRRFELAIVALLAIVGAGFVYLFFDGVRESYSMLASGLVPRLGGGTLAIAVAIIGATVMPHVIYLHSALQQNRIPAESAEERRIQLRYNLWDCIVGLGLAGVVNLAILCVAAAVFYRARILDIGTLQLAYSRLGDVVGGGAALAFGIALMASGMSSSSVGTYAGQVIMAGFMRWHIPLPVRRGLTMLPSLLILGFAASTGGALVSSQIALAFGIPFALIPLLIVARDRAVMADMTNRRATTASMLGITIVIICFNGYLLFRTVRGLI